MIVAMVPVRVVQMVAHPMIEMIAVRDKQVTARPGVHVPLVVVRAAAIMPGCAAVRVPLVHGHHVLFHPAVALMMQVTVVHVIDVATVDHSRVVAVRAMLVGVRRMDRRRHRGDMRFPST